VLHVRLLGRLMLGRGVRLMAVSCRSTVREEERSEVMCRKAACIVTALLNGPPTSSNLTRKIHQGVRIA
jgi:hypothetical protein